METFRPTWIEVDLGRLAQNVQTLRARLPLPARLMAVVKADAYGHGAVQVAQTALGHGADALAVAIPEEGAQLRGAGLTAPILVLGGIAPEGAEAALRYALTQTIFDADTARALETAARERGGTARVHIKIDSGMGRVGVRDENELRALLAVLADCPHVTVTGVFTHFATADAEDLAFTHQQAVRFAPLAAIVKKAHPAAIAHAANSATLLRCPQYAFDMARAGIALYVNPDIPGDAGAGLGDLMSWKTRAVHVKTIAPGETVSYGRRFTAERPTRVMTLPVGYADGYHRAIGGKGRALVRGQSAPVIGRVCMDQTMLDVTEIPGAKVGDEVVLLGQQGTERITAREMGQWCGMIDYEIVLSPTARVPRVYL
ncbi:MAG: alanine racemase [Oscillospiraceae bacterium]|jgi:alanine racemase|nr:alanine racemase [Oscillospiraceae bacterium]